MKLQTLVILLAAPLVLCQSISGASDLIPVLQSNPDTQGFGDLLEEFPDLVTSLNASKNYTVFAPSNDAVTAFRASLNSSGVLNRRNNRIRRRSLPAYAAAIALLFTDRSNQANLNTQPTDLITNLTDPAYINIGPVSTSVSLTQSSSATSSSVSSTSSPIASTSSSPPSSTSTVAPTTSSVPTTTTSTTLTTASSVQSSPSTSSSSPPPPAPPPAPAGCPSLPGMKTIGSKLVGRQQSDNGTEPLLISVYSGFGNASIASTTEQPFSMGAIRAVDNFFTLFPDLPTTLAQTNGTAFSTALSKANLLDSLSNTPRITVFVPTDAALQGQTLDATTLKQYIVFNTLATTTNLASGGLTSSSGQSVNVTTNADGSYTVNGVTISGENTMIKNGVVHYVDGVFAPLTYAGAAPALKTPILPVTAIAVALLVSYMGMTSF